MGKDWSWEKGGAYIEIPIVIKPKPRKAKKRPRRKNAKPKRV